MIFFSSILDLEILRFRFALRLPFLELKPPVIWFILLQSLICGTNCTRCFFCPIDTIALFLSTIMHNLNYKVGEIQTEISSNSLFLKLKRGKYIAKEH